MVMDFSKFSDEELLSMYNSSQPRYGVDRHSIMGDQSLNSMLPNRAVIQDFIDKQIYSKTPAPAVKTGKQVVNKQPVADKQALKQKPTNTTQITRKTNKVVPTETIQQFVYETPEAKQDYINRIEEFAANYPAMVEQDRRRRMQAALLAPVIDNERFVNEAIGQSPIDTTAKQLELLNTAANARVSEAQRPYLAQAFANAGMPAELAYASEDQLKSIVNLLVAKTNMGSAMYKANVASQLGKYKADKQLEGVKIATAAKRGPEKLIQVLGQAGYSADDIDEMLNNVYGPQWKNMMGTGAPIQFNLGSGQVQGPENIIFADE